MRTLPSAPKPPVPLRSQAPVLIVTLEKASRRFIPRTLRGHLYGSPGHSWIYLPLTLTELDQLAPEGLTLPATALDGRLNVKAVADRAAAMKLVAVALGYAEDSHVKSIGLLESEKGR